MYNTDRKTILKKEKLLKKNNLRYCEYYDMQDTFDLLYSQSKNNSTFKNLYSIITSDANIKLAYRTIKRNSGSKTAGTNRHTIKDIENQSEAEFCAYIKNRIENFQPQKVKRVYIPKSNMVKHDHLEYLT